ncbi:MAG: hypothetical protein KDK70_31335, partial [Myxococcales bacterium]|nr:hypothetical protein [Myxococcales bacterium]
RMFKYYFVPGVEALSGFQLLITIAIDVIAPIPNYPGSQVGVEAPAGFGDAMELISATELGPDFAIHGIPIPATLVREPAQVIEFISRVVNELVPSIVVPFERQGVQTNTDIRMSLLQVVYILVDFVGGLARLSTAFPDDPAAQQTIKALQDLTAKWAVRAGRPAQLELDETKIINRPHGYDKATLLGSQFSANLTYGIAKDLNRLQKHPSQSA